MRQNANPWIINIYMYLKPERIRFWGWPFSVMYAFWLLIVTLLQPERQTEYIWSESLNGDMIEGLWRSVFLWCCKAVVLSSSLLTWEWWSSELIIIVMQHCPWRKSKRTNCITWRIILRFEFKLFWSDSRRSMKIPPQHMKTIRWNTKSYKVMQAIFLIFHFLQQE